MKNSVILMITLMMSAVAAGPNSSYASSSESSTAANSSGGKITTTTKRSGTICTVFDAQGKVACTRSNAETNHKKAIKKCLKIKC